MDNSPPYRVRYSGIDTVAKSDGVIQVSCEIENASTSTWFGTSVVGENDGSPSIQSGMGPVQLSYSVFDRMTDRIVLEGERVSLGDACKPGEKRKVVIDVQMPPEAGRYRVWVSPVHEDVAWFYERNGEFIEIEADMVSERVVVQNVRCIDNSRLRWRRLRQIGERFCVYPLTTLVRYRTLIFSMAWRDVAGRYRGSMGGSLWTLINPLLLMGAYYFVFAVVMRVKFPTGSGGFLFYFLSGMLPWLAFSEAIGRAPGVVLAHQGFVKRVVFPLEILPLNLTAIGLVTELFAIVLLLLLLAGFGPGIHHSILFLPIILIPQLMLTAGLCWILAALGVFLRDSNQVIGFLLTIWFFVTPICYPETSLPQQWLWLLSMNPIYIIVDGYRRILLEGTLPALAPLRNLWLTSVLAYWIGFSWFFKTKKSFADVL